MPVWAYSFHVPKMDKSVWELLKASVSRMESTLTVMKDLRRFIHSPEALQKLDTTIAEHEKQLAELKRIVVN